MWQQITQVEELDGDAETETHIHIFEQEIVKEEEAFMAAIGIKKPRVPKPRVPSRPPKSRPAQPYEVNESVLANWNGQLTLAKVCTWHNNELLQVVYAFCKIERLF